MANAAAHTTTRAREFLIIALLALGSIYHGGLNHLDNGHSSRLLAGSLRLRVCPLYFRQTTGSGQSPRVCEVKSACTGTLRAAIATAGPKALSTTRPVVTLREHLATFHGGPSVTHGTIVVRYSTW